MVCLACGASDICINCVCVYIRIIGVAARRTLHRPNTAHLEHQPAQLLDVLGRAGRVADPPVCVVLIREVEHDGAALKHALGAVCDGWDAAVGVDLQEPSMLSLLSVWGAVLEGADRVGRWVGWAYSSFWALVLMSIDSVL